MGPENKMSWNKAGVEKNTVERERSRRSRKLGRSGELSAHVEQK